MDLKTMEDIADYLNSVRLKKKFFGGVDEEQLWQILNRVQEGYKNVFLQQEQKYKTLLEQAQQAQQDATPPETKPKPTEGG